MGIAVCHGNSTLPHEYSNCHGAVMFHTLVGDYNVKNCRRNDHLVPSFELLRGRAKINSYFTAREFWPPARRERRAYPAHGSVRSEQRSPRPKEPSGKCEVIFARPLSKAHDYKYFVVKLGIPECSQIGIRVDHQLAPFLLLMRRQSIYALAFRSPLHYCIVIACIIQAIILHMLYDCLHGTTVMVKSHP